MRKLQSFPIQDWHESSMSVHQVRSNWNHIGEEISCFAGIYQLSVVRVEAT